MKDRIFGAGRFKRAFEKSDSLDRHLAKLSLFGFFDLGDYVPETGRIFHPPEGQMGMKGPVFPGKSQSLEARLEPLLKLKEGRFADCADPENSGVFRIRGEETRSLEFQGESLRRPCRVLHQFFDLGYLGVIGFPKEFKGEMHPLLFNPADVRRAQLFQPA